MDQLVLDPLTGLSSSLTALTNSLTTTNTFAAAPAATEALLAADNALSSALVTLKKHQDNYAHILYLRSEALRVEEQIKDVIRRCNTFTREINAISPSILEDSDSDEEEEEEEEVSKGEVDYDILLTLASRIATYNTAAEHEAETMLLRAKRETPKNGNGESHQEPGIELTGMADAEIARDRAMKGMAFPDAEVLRLGALGRLQVIREQRGEDAVDDEIESLMLSLEGDGIVKADNDIKMEGESDLPQETRPRRASQNARAAPAPSRSQQQHHEKKKVNLDLWEGDDEDEDD